MQTTKKRKEVEAKVEKGRAYTLAEAAALIKEVNTTKFNASIDVHVRLGIDPRKEDQSIRGTVTLPHGTGKTKKILVFCNPDQVQDALNAGADYAGLDEYIEKVSAGWTDVDVIIATPATMPKIGRLGRILGPRNLMPNPKTGTVTADIVSAITEVKAGKISFRVDKFGIVHSTVGRVNFEASQINDNANELIATLIRMKPSSAKGIYVKSIYMASTMSPSINIDPKSIKA